MLRFIPLPPGVPEALLLILILTAIIGVVVLTRRRRRHARAEADVSLPDFKTEQTALATVRRVYRDPAQGVWLVEATVGKTGKRRLVFCAADYETDRSRYDSLVGKTTVFHLYGMATLAPGGADAIRDQIRDAERITPDMVRLLPGGQYANDHVVIGRILSHQEETVSEVPVYVYRTQVIRNDDLTLVLELAAERLPDAPPLPNDAMTHGSARLYGYLG